MPRPNADVIANQLAAAGDAQNRAARDMAAIIAKGRHVARDGFPSSSGGGSGASSEISRPTENTAIADPMHDPTATDIRDIVTICAEIYQASLRLDVLRGRVMAPEERKGLHVNETPECVNPNCAKPLIGDEYKRRVAGRCRACYDYRRNDLDQNDRPLHLIEAERARVEKRGVA